MVTDEFQLSIPISFLFLICDPKHFSFLTALLSPSKTEKMEKEVVLLYQQLDNDLQPVMSDINLIARSVAALEIINPVLAKLLELFSKNKSDGSEDPILINRQHLPRILAEYFFYTSLHNIDINKPVGSLLKPYYEKQQARLEDFFNLQPDFHRYYRSGKDNLDQFYFAANHNAQPLLLEPDLPGSTLGIFNRWSLLAAQAIANERLLCFIMDSLNMIDGKHFIEKDSLPGMEWTGSKTDLVELIYAFYAAGVFDNGKTTISELIRYIEKLFGINLGNTSMTFQEILRRKQSTVFLDKLKSKLEMHMTRIEEKSRR